MVLGNVLYRGGRPLEAEAHYRTVLAIKPTVRPSYAPYTGGTRLKTAPRVRSNVSILVRVAEVVVCNGWGSTQER
eukprot:SAG11_NODE_2327_length_3516_cov_2.408838_3_plen_75_part_00